MSELFEKSLRTLELPRVLQLLSDAAVSAEAKERALRVSPETEPEEVLRLLDQTDAARQMIGRRGAPSFSGVKPVAEALDRADRGGSLNPRELLRIADLLTAARRAKEYFNEEAEEKTAIDHLFLSLHGNHFLEDKIKRCIPDEDTIADAASPELADIRRHMRLAQAKSPEDAEEVRESFQARIDYMAGDEEEPGGAFYPGPIRLWTNSAQVVVRGNYVLMVVADDGDEIVSRFDALFEQET